MFLFLLRAAARADCCCAALQMCNKSAGPCELLQSEALAMVRQAKPDADQSEECKCCKSTIAFHTRDTQIAGTPRMHRVRSCATLAPPFLLAAHSASA